MPIKPLKSVANKAYSTLHKYQSGELTPIKTGREWLDEIFGGLLPMDIVTIAGASGGGKSFELQRIKNFIMNKENNSNADKYVWVSNSLEMRMISNIIRDLNITLKKSKKKILTEKFTDEEKKLVEDYYNNSTDERFFINEEASLAEQFESDMRAFLRLHVDKEAVFVDIDHIALQRDKNGNKKLTVDEMVEAINRLKKEFPNTYWFILSQLNRNILDRIREKDIMSMPNRGDVFQSDSMFFISDYLYVCHNPHRLGINQFSKVNIEIYDYLAKHLTEENKGKASFDTVGKIFYIILKMREAEIFYKDIYIEDIEIEGKEKYREPVENYSIEDLSTPKFEPKPIDRTEQKVFVNPNIFDNREPLNNEEDDRPF